MHLYGKYVFFFFIKKMYEIFWPNIYYNSLTENEIHFVSFPMVEKFDISS